MKEEYNNYINEYADEFVSKQDKKNCMQKDNGNDLEYLNFENLNLFKDKNYLIEQLKMF